MKLKIVKDIVIGCHKPSTNVRRFQIPIVRQVGLRWCLLLRNEKFAFPNFVELDILIIENPSVDNIEVELADAPSSGPNRRIYCFVPSIFPDNQVENLVEMANEATYHSIRLFCQDQATQLRSTDMVREAIRQSVSVPIPRLVVKSRAIVASLGMSPGGPIAAGGELTLAIKDRVSGKLTERKLLEFENYALANTLFHKMTISNNEIRFEGDSYWKSKFAELPSEIVIFIDKFLSNEEGVDWFMTDVRLIRKRLLTPVLEPI
ncbi:MAG: hypothetical protein Q8T09_03910 [Candidatus Melainabacteria bacterium]|nr:hypothetical protein [Candidatus Melainabacteria bacterium]